MRISEMKSVVRPVTLFLLPALLLMLLRVQLFSQDRPRADSRIENGRWELVNDEVIITFDLIADAELTYDIKIVLVRESDKAINIVPVTVTGAVGEGKHAGKGKQIRWEYKKDVGRDLPGDDYSFVIRAKVIKAGGSNLLYYLAGGAVLLGGAAAVLLLGGKAAESAATPGGGMPIPPAARPSGQ